MYLVDIIGFIKSIMDEDKETAVDMKNAGFDRLSTYYKGRYDAYSIILPLIKKEAKRIGNLED